MTTTTTTAENRISIYNRTCQYLGHMKTRSQWERGVREYAIELMENLAELDNDDFASASIVQRALLNGASDWQQYSEGGCSLCYDGDIAHRLCTPSEIRRLHYREGGFRNPNREENWLDIQTRALHQAAHLIQETITNLIRQNDEN